MSRVNEPGQPSRRRLLACALGAVMVGGMGCTGQPSTPPQPDPLEALRAAALADATLADLVATTHLPLAAAASALAADRRAHATALEAEVLRATPSVASSTSEGAAPPVVSPDRATAVATLLNAMTASQAQASGLVGGLPRYRAGLVASIAACCASHQAVLA